MRRSILLAVLFLAVTFTNAVTASKRPPVPGMRDLAITWWGQSDGGSFMLLELNEQGTGTLVLHSRWTGNQAAYRVRATRLAAYDIAFDLEPVGEPTQDVVLRGLAYRGALDLKMRSRSLRWKDEVAMRPWSEVTTALDALKARRDQLRATKDGR